MVLIIEDSILPDHIRPSEGMTLGPVTEVETVLLLGATGTLGPYLLRELSHHPNIKKIYCLIRKTGKAPPLDRVLNRLKAVRIEDQVDMTKVECIQGDITEDKFGLSEVEYGRLATDIDAIVNSAVRADHVAKYYKAQEGKKLDLRAVNVLGTVRTLQFAVDRKLKHVYHGSTILTVLSTLDNDGNECGCLSEEYQDIDAYGQVPYNVGYAISKSISEQLCRQAAERGIPVKTFRHPFIGGDSQTGRCDYASNHIILRWLAYLRLKRIPEVLIPMMVIPVDDCARISLEVFFNPGSPPSDVYNMVHPGGSKDQVMIKIAEEFGISLKPVPMTEFLEKLKLEVDDSPLAQFKKLYVDEENEHIQIMEGHVPVLKAMNKCAELPGTFYMSRKLSQLIDNYHGLESTEDVMRRDIRFLKQSGVFDKYGIK